MPDQPTIERLVERFYNDQQRRLPTYNETDSTARGLAVKTILQRQIEATDAQIDRLVYALYGLTEEEIAIVEGGGLGERLDHALFDL